MMNLDETDVKILKLYYDLGKNEKPDLWNLMLKENTDLKTNGNAQNRQRRTRKYNALKMRIKRLKKELVDIDTIKFSQRVFDSKKLKCIEIKIRGFWNIHALEN